MVYTCSILLEWISRSTRSFGLSVVYTSFIPLVLVLCGELGLSSSILLDLVRTSLGLAFGGSNSPYSQKGQRSVELSNCVYIL